MEVSTSTKWFFVYLIPGRIGIWKYWFLRRRENQSTRRKTSRSKEENQQQTQPTYGVEAGSWTRALSPLPHGLLPGKQNYLFYIRNSHSRVFHLPSPLFALKKLAPARQAKCYREYCTFPRAFDNNNLRKIWGSNRV